jgi:hypothetical protein
MIRLIGSVVGLDRKAVLVKRSDDASEEAKRQRLLAAVRIEEFRRELAVWNRVLELMRSSLTAQLELARFCLAKETSSSPPEQPEPPCGYSRDLPS